MLHTVAFEGARSADDEGGLARPLLCSAAELERLTLPVVDAFARRRCVGDNVVVVASGLAHDELTPLAERLLSALPPRATSAATPRAQPVVYRGGSHALFQAADNSDDVTHVAFALAGAGVESDDLYLVCLLQQLLGGGESFSTGGPGKGMHSLLYR